MTTSQALMKKINEEIARQCASALLDADGFSIEDWLEEEFGNRPNYKMRPYDWVSRFVWEATNGRAEFTFDPRRNQPQIRVGDEHDEDLIAYQDVNGPVGDFLKAENFRLGAISATEMMAMIQIFARQGQ